MNPSLLRTLYLRGSQLYLEVLRHILPGDAKGGHVERRQP